MKFMVPAVAAVAALLMGCGGGESSGTAATERPYIPPSERKEAWVSLDGRVGAENAGLLMAAKRGYFGDVGINVYLAAPSTPERTINYVATGTSDIGVAQLSQLAVAKAKGAPVVAVGSVLPQPTAAMIWLPGSGIDDVADLKGKTIAIAGVPSQKGFLRILLAEAGLMPEDVVIRRVGYDLVPALVSGRADAIFGGSGNLEGAALEARGLKPVVTPAQRLGIPAHEELVVVAPTRTVARDPQLVRDFMSAVARGNAAAVEDPKGAARAIEENNERDTSLSREATEAQVEATLPLLSDSGSMDADQAGELADWMFEQGMLERRVAASELLIGG